MKAIQIIRWIKQALTEQTCCEQLKCDCRQGRHCPLRKG